MKKNIEQIIERLSNEKFNGRKIEWNESAQFAGIGGSPFIEDEDNKYFLYEDTVITHPKESNKYTCYECGSDIAGKMTFTGALSPQFYCPNCQDELEGPNVIDRKFMEKALFNHDSETIGLGFFRHKK